MIVALIFDMVEDSDGAYYIGFHPGPDSVVFRSTDGGQTWQSTGRLNGAYEALCLLKTSDGTIFAGTTPNGDVFKYMPVGVEEKGKWEIGKEKLLQNYPNPFVSETEIAYQLPTAGNISVKVYNIAGKFVKVLVDGQQKAGYHTVRWNGKDMSGRKVSSGIYFYQLEANSFKYTKGLILLR
ncbi:MAG: T9SS type A sorting domain-containing protein [Candidatus Stahlbacteria bacterium]|nr:T9SS type A sorting domain-containing protein [Candidatus Stahlbacteria bacterium]